MAVQGLTVTLTTSAVALAGNGLHGTLRVVIRNRGTGTAYLGGSDVTTAGFPLTTVDNHVDLVIPTGDTLYGTSTGAAVAQILRFGETT